MSLIEYTFSILLQEAIHTCIKHVFFLILSHIRSTSDFKIRIL